MKSKILLVDDEDHILAGYKRNLRNRFVVFTANGGQLGLEKLEEEGPFALVISDFKMPQMNGNQFLAKVKEVAPDTVRIMLTGYADLSTTIDAVNEGNIFRLLTKPCTIDKLLVSINEGVRQHNLIIAEKILLDKTLKGTIKMLIGILSTVNPVAFSRASRFQKFILQIGSLLNIHNVWELEISSLLSQIGLVTMPVDLLEKKYSGEKLSDEQEEIFKAHPAVGKSLLENIPRLENIAEAIYHQFHSFAKGDDNIKYGEALPLVSRILKVLNDFDTFVTAGNSLEDAYDKLKRHEKQFDPNVIIALDATIAGIYQNLSLNTVVVKKLEAGVVAAADIVDKNELVLITKGAEITEILKMKLINYVKIGGLKEEVKILK